MERVLALDWLRGLGVLIMLQGHLFNSFARADLHNQPVYVLSQFIGGMPAPIFLFLVGATLAFRLDRTDREDLPPAARLRSALQRAAWLAAIAFAFRLQLWLFAWGNPWTEIVRVDILNCMALGVTVLSPAALLTPQRRITWCAAAGVAIAALAPLVSMVDWSGVPWLVRNYLAPNIKAFFSFFPGCGLYRLWRELRRAAAHGRAGPRPDHAMGGVLRAGARGHGSLFFQPAILDLSELRFLAG